MIIGIHGDFVTVDGTAAINAHPKSQGGIFGICLVGAK